MALVPQARPEIPLPGEVVLSIETSSRRGSIALRGADGTVSEADLDESSSHGSDLLPALDRLMRAAGDLPPASIQWVAVGTGPGSYTGLRVGAATALGLARGAEAKLVGVPSLSGMGLGGLLPGECGAAVRNAFGGQVYLATYARSDDPEAPLVETSAPGCYEPNAALELMEPCTAWLIDEKTLEVLGSPDVTGREIRPPVVHAKDILTLALQQISQGVGADGGPGRHFGPDAVKPLYLRPFEPKNRRR